MLRILLLDCSESLKAKLRAQGFEVEAGTAGYVTGSRKLPSQVYESDVIFYNPEHLPKQLGIGSIVGHEQIKDLSHEFSLKYLEKHIEGGATVVVFVNRLSDEVQRQNDFYRWIPFMPPIEYTSDRIVKVHDLRIYPYNYISYLSPIANAENIAIPVLHKLNPPKANDYPCDVFHVFWNNYGHTLGVVINRGRGRLIVLPKFHSNDDAVDTFVHRILPKLYRIKSKQQLTDIYQSPAETQAKHAVSQLTEMEEKIHEDLETLRVELTSATRTKVSVIEADDTAKHVLSNHEKATRDEDAALFFLYKILEAIENKLGGERKAIATLGLETEWKAVKRLANESYRDARHAPKPGDIIKKWTPEEIEKCFAQTEAIALAYFNTLF